MKGAREAGAKGFAKGAAKGAIGLFAHAQLYWVAVQFDHLHRQAMGLPPQERSAWRVDEDHGHHDGGDSGNVDETGVGLMPFEMPMSVWVHQPPPPASYT